MFSRGYDIHCISSHRPSCYPIWETGLPPASVTPAGLWYEDFAPWPYVDFLDYAAERLFLRKVGGGYRTILPTFMLNQASQ
jgi:hypothetical protein